MEFYCSVLVIKLLVFQVFDFKLSAEDMASVDSLNKSERLLVPMVERNGSVLSILTRLCVSVYSSVSASALGLEFTEQFPWPSPQIVLKIPVFILW